MVLFVAIVVVRLYYLQIAMGESFENLADEIFVREEERVAKRGKITDREGKVIADTRTYYEIALIPQYLEDLDRVIESLIQLVPLDPKDIRERLHKARYEAKFRPVVIAEDVPYDWVAKIREHQLSDYNQDSEFFLSGVRVQSIPIRRYLYPFLFSHALGYLTEIDKARLEKAKETAPGVYTLGDLRGASGLENAYDLALKGEDGVLAHVVDARGREVTENEDLNTLKQRTSMEPIPGATLVSTIDFDAQ